MPSTNAPKSVVKSDVTVVLTSCNRPDLLDRTLQSFFQQNTYPLKDIIIIEDSGLKNINGPLKKKYKLHNITWIDNKKRLGQVASIDLAYSKVTTPYIFHCEEDWEFSHPNFIEKSKTILEKRSKIIQVHLTGNTNNVRSNKKIYFAGGVPYRFIKVGQIWCGFSWNPGLRRLKDYKLIGPFTKHAKREKYKREESGFAEAHMGLLYKSEGFRAATLLDLYVQHIGETRHVT